MCTDWIFMHKDGKSIEKYSIIKNDSVTLTVTIYK